MKNGEPGCKWHYWEFLTYLTENEPRSFHLQVIILIYGSLIDSSLLFIQQFGLQA